MLDLHSIKASARMLAAHEGLSVRTHHEHITNFYTTPDRVIHIPEPQLDWPESFIPIYRNGISHETGHWSTETRDIFEWLDANPISTECLSGAMLNIVDDLRNDNNRCRKFPGVASDRWYSTKAAIEDIWIPRVKVELDDMEQNDLILTTMIAAFVLAQGVIHAPLLDTYLRLKDLLINEKTQEWLEKIEADAWIDRWLALDSAVDEWEYVEDILRDVFEVDPEDVTETPPEPPPNGGSEEGEDGSEEGETGKGQNGGEETSEDGDKPAKGKFKVKYEDILAAHDNQWVKTQTGQCELEIDYDDYTIYGPYIYHDRNDTDKPSSIWPHTAPSDHHIGEFENTCEEVESISRKASKYLQAITQRKTRRNLKKGRLDASKLHKVATHPKDIDEDPAVFKRKSAKREIDTAVSVLIDCSGSMDGDKFTFAIASGYGMIKLCTAAGVPFEVALFTEENDTRNIHAVLKTFSEKFNRAKFFEEAAIAARNKGCNADPDNILIAYNRIINRPERKKLIVVMSDGSPASSRGDAYSEAKKLVSKIENDSPVDIMGVGMLSSNVLNIYRNNQVIQKADEIPEGLIEILKNHVLLDG